MATTAETIRASYPLPVYNYRVEIGSTSIAFSEVSGLVIGYEVGTYKESPVSTQAGPRTFRFPGQRTAPTVSLKKGIVQGVSIKELYGWIQTVQTNQVVKKDVFIRLCDEKGVPVISWKVINAFPTKLTAPTFDAKSNDAAIESLDLQGDQITMEAS
ncbi:MAG: phage tail protein [Cyanobium sp.]|jgi:phage tail-like protein